MAFSKFGSASAEPVAFLVIYDKHVDRELKHGCFTALSDGAGILQTKALLERYRNLQIETEAGKLFAKVMEPTDSGWLVRFTAKPPEFTSWRRAHRKSGTV